MVDLGYWAKPFILEDSYLDDQKTITYSVPLNNDWRNVWSFGSGDFLGCFTVTILYIILILQEMQDMH